MRDANARFEAALRGGDVDAALRPTTSCTGCRCAVAANAAIEAVLDQFTPVLRRAERLRFSTLTGRGSVARHDELIRLCEDGDAPGAAALAFDTWHSLDPDETTSTD